MTDISKSDDAVVFHDEHPVVKPRSTQRPWKVMVVDDEEEVHAITSLVLRDLVFEGRPVEFIHAYSAAEARSMLEQEAGVAVIFLDVVMEHQHAGLELARWIREVRRDPLVRIILRTGQPGLAPEREIITLYDINDYKEKTELTDIKLWTSLMVALRGYRDLSIIKRSHQGLEKIVQASVLFTERQSMNQFFQGVLTQLTSLLHVQDDSVMLRAEGMAVQRTSSGDFRIISGTGVYARSIGLSLEELGDPYLSNLVMEGLRHRECRYRDGFFVGYLHDDDGSENVIVMKTPVAPTPDETELVKVFISHASIALINVSLSHSIESSQGEMIFTLGEVVESRSVETGNHVRRVASLGAFLAEKVGLVPREVEHMRYALPLHDIGKIGIPDAILNKPGPLTEEELLEMRRHTTIGFTLLHGGAQRTMQLAATIALSHHERWDGRGYPQGLKGTEIPLVGRIACLVDVVDALLHQRVYKEPWDWPQVVEYLNSEAGGHFDPALVETFLASLDEVKGLLAGMSPQA